jgi:hypothetical protein
MNNSTIKITKNNNGLVTKVFAENAKIFGSSEFKAWREFLEVFPNAKMVVEKKNNNSNCKLTYKNMEIYIKDKKPELKKEFDNMRKISKIQRSPYNYVLDWFKIQFPEFAPKEDEENDNTNTENEIDG